jgi:hypothetical protein
VGDEEDGVRQAGQRLEGVGDLAGDADGGAPRDPAVDGAYDRGGAGLRRLAAEVAQLLLDEFRCRQREHIAAFGARHLGHHRLWLAAPRRPDQHLDSNQFASPEMPTAPARQGTKTLKCTGAG